MRIITVHIGTSIFKTTFLVLATLIGLFSFFTFVDQAGEIGTGQYGMLAAVQYVLYTIPRNAYTVMPIVVLIGSILAMSAFQRTAELTTLRASGVSPLRITSIVLKVALIFAALSTLLGEFVVPYSEHAAQAMRSRAMGTRIARQADYGVWLKDRSSLAHIAEIFPDLSLRRVKLYEFDEKKKIRTASQIEKAYWINDGWRLEQVKSTHMSNREGKIVEYDVAVWSTDIGPQTLSVFMVKPEQLSTFSLWRYIKHLESNSQTADRFRMAFWSKLTMPILIASLVPLAVPFAFGNVRTGSQGTVALIGVLIGLFFFLLTKVFNYLAVLFDFPLVVGVTGPILVAILLSFVFFRPLYTTAVRRRAR